MAIFVDLSSSHFLDNFDLELFFLDLEFIRIFKTCDTYHQIVICEKFISFFLK